MKISRTFLALALTAGIALTGAACTATEHEHDAEPTSSASPTPEVDPVVTLTDEVGARAELTDFVCEETEGTWKVSGTVTNPTDADAVYIVNVAVIDSDSRSSIVRRNIQLEVEGQAAAEFSEEKFAENVPGIGHECVVRVNRGTGVEG